MITFLSDARIQASATVIVVGVQPGRCANRARHRDYRNGACSCVGGVPDIFLANIPPPLPPIIVVACAARLACIRPPAVVAVVAGGCGCHTVGGCGAEVAVAANGWSVVHARGRFKRMLLQPAATWQYLDPSTKGGGSWGGLAPAGPSWYQLVQPPKIHDISTTVGMEAAWMWRRGWGRGDGDEAGVVTWRGLPCWGSGVLRATLGGVAGRQGLGVAVSRRGTARRAGVAWGSVVARALHAALKRRGGLAGSCAMWQGDVAESRRAVGGGWALRSALSGVAGAARWWGQGVGAGANGGGSRARGGGNGLQCPG
ncbi:hypothetical protein EDB84DRAFT_1433915 [Lactarius hengduanensis]|nr:hypothetical protein EDB84DRAFT_1433915 [Lactarius hengduanensis]